jgi:hypothetical protein
MGSRGLTSSVCPRARFLLTSSTVELTERARGARASAPYVSSRCARISRSFLPRAHQRQALVASARTSSGTIMFTRSSALELLPQGKIGTVITYLNSIASGFVG